MDRKDRQALTDVLDRFLNDKLLQIVVSNSTDKEKISKVRVRPLMLRGTLIFQAEELSGKQAFHRNLEASEAAGYIADLLEGRFKQAQISSAQGQAGILVSKKGTVTVKTKAAHQAKILASPARLAHNRAKRYVLEEGRPVPFLIDLGVMTGDGSIVRSRYDKFRQINRFLEYIEDILPRLDRGRETTVIDFGCGKSYLTFAMYYYLRELKGYPVRIIGLDLKRDVIDKCNSLSLSYGFDTLKFYHGDIASFEGVDQVDMVVTLHACDTATDYALAKAILWRAKVILSVPCCQHELNSQIENELLTPALKYGLIKERMAALYTDAIRAEILENQGYRTQILEFIDMEHTPKNILIRAVRQGEKKDNRKELEEMMNFLNVDPTLWKLCVEERGII